VLGTLIHEYNDNSDVIGFHGKNPSKRVTPKEMDELFTGSGDDNDGDGDDGFQTVTS